MRELIISIWESWEYLSERRKRNRNNVFHWPRTYRLIMAKIWKIMANRYSEHKMIISYWAGGQLVNRLAIGAVLVWFPTRRYTVRYREVGVPHRRNFQVPVTRCHVGRQSLRERGSTRIRKVHSFIEQISIDIGRAGTTRPGLQAIRFLYSI